MKYLIYAPQLRSFLTISQIVLLSPGHRGNPYTPENKMRIDGLFVCVEVLQPSQPNGVMLSVVSLPNHRFTGQA